MKHRPKVYFIPLDTEYARGRELFSLQKVLSHRIYRLLEIFKSQEIVGIKIDSSNKKERTLPDHKMAATICSLLQSRQISPILCDSSDRYKNRETNAAKHMQMAFAKGFSHENTNTPFIMLDGANGKLEFNPKAKTKNEISLAGEIDQLSGMITISHPIAHELAGFEGTLFTLGHGLASKKGKTCQHSSTIPRVNSSRCYYCRKCMHQCPVEAIYVTDRHIEIDSELCINCGQCVDIAQRDGIVYDWNATPEYFQEKVANYASAAYKRFTTKTLHINYLMSLPTTVSDEKIDIGILISKDPLAIDVATVKLLERNQINYPTPIILQDRARQQNIGSKEYDLETIDY